MYPLAMFLAGTTDSIPHFCVYLLLVNTASSTIRCCLTLHNKWESGLIDINGLYPGRFLGSQRYLNKGYQIPSSFHATILFDIQNQMTASAC